MKHVSFAVALSLIIVFSSCNNAEKNEKKESDQASNEVFPKGEKITNNNFTGNAWLHQMIMSDSLNPTQIGNVTFEPGARTNWHLHPGGQFYSLQAEQVTTRRKTVQKE